MEVTERAAETAPEEVVAPPEKKTVVVAEKPPEIQMEGGLLVPQNLSEAMRVARGLLETGCIPRQYKTIPQVLMGMQFLRQLGLPDIAGLPRLAIVHGSYSLWGEGPKAVCQTQIEDFEEFWFDVDYKKICFDNKNLHEKVFGALCRVKRKGVPTWTERTFTTLDAQIAGLLGKEGPWRQYEKRMLQMRTRSWALKDAFPDKMLGIGIAEYDHNTIIDAEIVGSAPEKSLTAADEVNQAYSDEKSSEQPGAAS